MAVCGAANHLAAWYGTKGGNYAPTARRRCCPLLPLRSAPLSAGCGLFRSRFVGGGRRGGVGRGLIPLFPGGREIPALQRYVKDVRRSKETAELIYTLYFAMRDLKSPQKRGRARAATSLLRRPAPCPGSELRSSLTTTRRVIATRNAAKGKGLASSPGDQSGEAA
jgi:hypothetical protein